MFPEYIEDSVCQLRRLFHGGRNFVAAEFPIVEIVGYWNDREISLKLFYTADGLFEIQPPDEIYHGKASHYTYRKPERRWVRNKGYLFSVVRKLKTCGLWQYVVNKDFLIVNSFNKNTDPATLLKALDGMLDG